MEQPTPSLYAQYIKEREFVDTIEMFYGFMTYKVLDDSKTVYIRDCYILPEYRGQGKSLELAEMVEAIGKTFGCITCMTSVDINTPGASKNLRTYIGYKFNITLIQNNHMVYLTRPIN